MPRSSFAGLNIAASGLFVAQRQLDVTAHNIDNETTAGYSRQRFVQAAVDPYGSLVRIPPMEKGRVGLGVETLRLDQIRDAFIDRQYRSEFSRSAYWNERATNLYYVEDLFGDIDTSGLNSQMDKFFLSFQELNKNTVDKTYREYVADSAEDISTTLYYYYSQTRDLTEQTNEQVKVLTNKVNDILHSIEALNEKIFDFELTGNAANDLRDKRNLLIDELSGLVDVKYEERPESWTGVQRLRLWVGDTLMVDHDDVVEELAAVADGTNDFWEMVKAEGAAKTPPEAVPDLYRVYLKSRTEVSLDPNKQPVYTARTGAAPFAYYSGMLSDPLDPNSPKFTSGISPHEKNGQLQSLLDLRDGAVLETQGIPYFINQLNQLVNQLVTEVNTIHRQGWTMPYTDTGNVFHESRNGLDFFDPSGTQIWNLKLSADIDETKGGSYYNIANSDVQVVRADGDDSSGDWQTGNPIVAQMMAKLKDATNIGVIGGFSTFMKMFQGSLGVETAYTNGMAKQEDTLILNIDYQRQSVMGVNLDEEMTNMIKFQHSYNSAARMITAMDENLDVLINRTGRVGL